MRGATRFAVALAAITGAFALIAGPAAASSHKSKPVVFVHGLDAFGTCPSTDGNATWNEMIRAMNDWGWSGGGGMWDVAYYKCDVGYRHWINHHGDHGQHYASGHVLKDDGTCCSHNQNANIRHLAFHLVKFIRSQFEGRCIEAVGHSMGGLILRYGIAQVQRNNPDFPNVCVEDIVTFGTPHGSTPWAFGCGWTQCEQMRPSSEFMDWIRANAWEPDAGGGTQWTVIGSYDDFVVDEDSAVDMGARFKVKYLGSMNIGHSDYMHRLGTQGADVLWKAGSDPWFAWYDAPGPVRWAETALWAVNW